MKPLTFMLIAGEASGDQLAAELVGALRERVIARSMDSTSDAQPLRTALAPRFFGAGGPRMAAAGVELAFDMTKHSVIGISEVLKNYSKYRRLFKQLLRLAIERQPDVIIGVDYGGFNLRFGKAIKNYVRRHRKEFAPWDPKIVQFVSPQVWASRPGRAYSLADNYDLLLSIFPFEKDWYAKRVPKLRVEFVGHPMVGRFSVRSPESNAPGTPPFVLLLPGSRADEVRRHWPVVTSAFELLRRELPTLRGKMILPSQSLADSVKPLGLPLGLEIQVGGLTDALAAADLAITKSGTITMECATFGVPAVVFYKTSWPTYFIGKQIISVKYLAMPNLLAGEEIFPEFIQHEATVENISHAALELLQDGPRRAVVKAKLVQVINSLGGPGATGRAADAITSLLP
ncbi:MAG: lipid-A-disaccharide synthase [Verrucomicrobia bacterium]|nr:lipid-A-disaccharide synthase [Verrucomicrobiota bacterium]